MVIIATKDCAVKNSFIVGRIINPVTVVKRVSRALSTISSIKMKLETLFNIRGGTSITRLGFHSDLSQDRETLRSTNMLACANRNISRTVLIITASC